MIEAWSRWKEELVLPPKLVLVSLIDNKEGFFLNLADEVGEDKRVIISFEDHVLSYRNRDEGDFLKKLCYIGEKYGDEFYVNWSLFEVTCSEYLKWFKDESFGIYEDETIKHYVFLTNNDVVEVLSVYEPNIEIQKIT